MFSDLLDLIEKFRERSEDAWTAPERAAWNEAADQLGEIVAEMVGARKARRELNPCAC